MQCPICKNNVGFRIESKRLIDHFTFYDKIDKIFWCDNCGTLFDKLHDKEVCCCWVPDVIKSKMNNRG